MASVFSLLLLPGDGIGVEVVNACQPVLQALADKGYAQFHCETALIGGAAYDAEGTPLSDATIEKARAADAVLLGAVGGPKWADVAYDLRPEAGLLKLRSALGLYANIRPAVVYPALARASSLKEELISGLDIVIVRELVGGVYFGRPRGIETLADGQQRGFDTQVYTTSEIERIAHSAFQLAAKRGGKVCSVDKANVLASSRLWREVVIRVHAAHYPQIALSHMYVDNCAMQLVRQPKQFDVILTDNLFGDILSDCAAMLTGSLGMLPSASLGAGKAAVFEPVHGSAPDIAGQDKANPLATILSVAMMCRYHLNIAAAADAIENAVAKILFSGARTADIAQNGDDIIGTAEMGKRVAAAIT